MTEHEQTSTVDAASKIGINLMRVHEPGYGFLLTMLNLEKYAVMTGFIPDAEMISIIKYLHGVFEAERKLIDIEADKEPLEAGEGC